MASVERINREGGVAWLARYRDPAGAQKKKSFKRRTDADRYLASVAHEINTGGWVDPAAGRITVGEWATRWFAGQAHLKPTTAERYAGIIRTHIEPQWATVHLDSVRHADVQAWVTRLGQAIAPASVRKTHRVFSLMLDLAVRDSRLARNPANGVNLPRVRGREHTYLTHRQVAALADAAGGYRLVVLFLAYTGLRYGEMAALRVERVDLMRRRASVVESVTEVSGRLVWGSPKTHERRDVPLPKFLADELVAHCAGAAPERLLFTGSRSGGVLRSRTFRRAAFDNAAKEIGLPTLTPHDLRHSAASLAISAGANVKAVQRMLGHASAAMTLDTYSGLFPDDLDLVATKLDAAREAVVPVLCPSGTVTPITECGLAL